METSASTASVLFFVLGTRGDVQPLAVLADSLKCQEPGWEVQVATHAEHKVTPSHCSCIEAASGLLPLYTLKMVTEENFT